MAKGKTAPAKVRKNFLVPADLAAWVESYAKKNHTTMTHLILEHLMNLRRESENGHAEQI